MTSLEKLEHPKDVPKDGLALSKRLARVSDDIIDFKFNGADFQAIRQEDWVAQQANGGIANALRKRVAGRLIFKGEVFVLFGRIDCASEAAVQSIVQRLTPRELKVGILIADGMTDKEIARKLGISAYTVREHCRRACAKLDVCKRSALVKLLFSAHLPR